MLQVFFSKLNLHKFFSGASPRLSRFILNFVDTFCNRYFVSDVSKSEMGETSRPASRLGRFDCLVSFCPPLIEISLLKGFLNWMV